VSRQATLKGGRSVTVSGIGLIALAPFCLRTIDGELAEDGEENHAMPPQSMPKPSVYP
jgi:hypothetical protein